MAEASDAEQPAQARHSWPWHRHRRFRYLPRWGSRLQQVLRSPIPSLLLNFPFPLKFHHLRRFIWKIAVSGTLWCCSASFPFSLGKI